MLKFHLPTDKPFVIAEIANAHRGSVEKLKKLVSKTIETKADAIKFQFFKTSQLLVDNHSEYDLYKRLEIADTEWIKIFKSLRKKNVKILSDIFSVERAQFANKLGVDGFKIHSSDINNKELLRFVASTTKPILLSCSGCNVNEIDSAVNVIKDISTSQIILMHGFQGFPTRISEINLKRISSLRRRYNLPVGYMDHISGDDDMALYMPLIAMGLGSNIIEKHITLDRKLKEEDYQSSLNPDEFKKMVQILRTAYGSLGTDSFTIIDSESNYRKNMKKRLVAKRNLKPKSIIRESDLLLKRTDYDTTDLSLDEVIGCRTKTGIKKDTAISAHNINLHKNKIVAAIACRVKSTRLYAKPLQKINNNDTILDCILYQLRQSNLIDEIVLAISENPANELFIEYARKNNLKFITGDDENVLHRLILAAEHVRANIVFRVTSEDPYKYWQVIDKAIEQHVVSNVDYTPCVDDLPQGTGFEIINLSALKRSNERGSRRNRSELATSYINEHKNEFKIKPFLVKANLRRPEIRLTVDYPEDLILARTLWSKLFKKTKLPNVEKIIEMIDKDPEISKIHNFAIIKSRTKCL